MHKGSSGSSPSVSDRLAGRAAAGLGLGLLAALALTTPCATARAQANDAKSACVAAYENSQVLRQQGHLVDAREALVFCTQQECPPLVRTDCGTWLQEVDRAMPSVVVQATADGVETTAVTVSIDGKVVKTGLDGKAIPTDPGSHQVRFEAAGFPPIETTVVVSEGEHYHALTAEFASPKAPPAPVRAGRPVPAAVWLLGGLTLAGAAGFTVFGLVGNQKKQSLQSQCAPFCPSSEVDIVQHQYLAADISLGVGVAALVTGAIVYFNRPEVPVRVGVAPLASGMALSAAGAF
jgi:hypothetical protein